MSKKNKATFRIELDARTAGFIVAIIAAIVVARAVLSSFGW